MLRKQFPSKKILALSHSLYQLFHCNILLHLPQNGTSLLIKLTKNACDFPAVLQENVTYTLSYYS